MIKTTGELIHKKLLLLLLSLFCFGVQNGFPQSVSGTIYGFVKDPQGATIASARVEARSVQIGVVVSTVSDDDGYYRLQNLIPGEHTVEISAPGFRTWKSSPQVVSVSEPIRLDAVLGIGTASESITVEANSTRVNSEDNQLGATIREVSRLPLLSGNPGRSPLDLVFLSAGAVRNQASPQPGLGSFNGQRVSSTNTMLDGAFANVQVTNNSDPAALFISPNAVAEIRIVTGIMKAEYGRNSGAAIVITTKSGGNQWHGAASEYFRNTKLNAANFFLKAVPGGTPELLPNGAKRKAPWNSTDFDANLGGPIRRNSTFFFVSFLDFIVHQGIVQSAVVPNETQRAAIESEGTPAARALLALVPPATVGNTLLSSPPFSGHAPQLLSKLDHSVSHANRFSSTYFFADFDTKFPFYLFSPVPGFGVNNNDRQQNVVLRDSHVFSPNLIQELRVAFTRLATHDLKPQNRTSLASLGLGAITPDNRASEGPPFVVIAGFSPFGNTSNGPQAYKVNNYQVLDIVSWNRDRHFVKFGGEFRTFAMNTTLDISPNGSITITGSGSTNPNGPIVSRIIPGLPPALNDFANGFATEFRQTSSGRSARRSRYAGFFMQDDWRVGNGFSISAGLRWDYNKPYFDIRDRIVSFRGGLKSRIFPDAPAGLVFPGDSGISRSTYSPDRNDFSPRLGFAWDVLRNAKLSLRGGFGLLYDAPFSEILSAVFLPPFTISPSTVSTDYANPWLGSRVNPIPQPFPYQPPRAGDRIDFTQFAPINFGFLDPSFRTPYVQQWNLQVQYQFPKDWLLEIGYVGNAGRKLSNEGEYNYALPDPGATTDNTNQRRILNQNNPQNAQFGGAVFGAVRVHHGNANSSYNGLQIQMSRRLANGFYMSSGYTWSHAIDNASGRRVASRPDPRQDRGNSEFDVRHNYTMGYVYELPFYRQKSGVTAHFFRGWGLSGRTSLSTGFYVSVFEQEDRCLCAINSGGGNNNRTDTTGATLVYLDPRSTTAVPGRPNSWFDGTGGGTPTAAANPYFRRVGSGQSVAQGGGRLGNAGRSTIRTPGMNEWNVSVFKRTTVKEGHVLEFRSEFYNAFNHANFMAPDINIGSPTFGIVTQTRDPRIIQMLLKYQF